LNSNQSPSIKSYGIRTQNMAHDQIDEAVESLRILGYAIVDSGFTQAEQLDFSQAFDQAKNSAQDKYSQDFNLKALDEHNTIRVPFAAERNLLQVALNPRVLEINRRLLGEYFVLSQQNGIINPPDSESYNQGFWHRDLPYQHFTSSRPLAINALYCVDEFTKENGATLVLPASHKEENFPSDQFIQKHSVTAVAPSGSYILLDCMTYHSGSKNQTGQARRALNNVFTMPLLRQQIDLPSFLGPDWSTDAGIRKILGYEVQTPRSISEYLGTRAAKVNKN